MLMAFLEFMGAALVIFIAGGALTRFADAIADITKLGRLLIGSLLLASATSLPELVVDISAVRQGMPNLALGDLLGSCLCNLFILAILDIVSHPKSHLFAKVSTAHALSGTLSISLTALLAMTLVLTPRLFSFEIGSLGPGAIVILIIYVFGVRIIYFDQILASGVEGSTRGKIKIFHSKLPKALAGYFAMAGIILVAAPFLAESAGKIADLSGLGKTFVGSTLVAFSTSLPELVTTREAVKRGAYDLAVGNIFGSNCFNIAIIAALDFVADGPILSQVSETHLITALSIIFVTAIAVMGQLYHAEKRKPLIEPDSILIILLVLGTFGLLYFVR